MKKKLIEMELKPVRSVAVLGAGTMGRGIAQVVALAGYRVSLYDLSDEILAQAMERIEAALDGGIKRGKLTEKEKKAVLFGIEFTTRLDDAVTDVDLVIEAAPEKLALKQDIFRSLGHACQPQAIMATNTSSLRVAAVASATDRPQFVVGMHFFNPPHIMKLVEIVRHDETAPEVIESVLAVTRRMKKEAIVVRDVPGFATSRLGIALGLEAMRMVEQEVASVEDIDRAMELGYNHPMGPLRLGDLVGLDVRLSIAEYLYQELRSEVFDPPEILRRMVREGKLGKKTGQGFYPWD